MLDLDDKVLDRVRKLLAKAEHPTTPPAEAEVFSQKAAALMARHAIDRALLEATAGSVTAEPQARTITVLTPYSLPKSVLLSQVADACRVRVALGPDRGDDGRLCTLVGFPVDLDTTEVLFTSLLLQATTAMLASAGQGRRNLRAFRRAFLLGFASSVGARLRQVQQETVEEATSQTPSAALVLVGCEKRVEAAFEERFPHLRTIRTTVSDGWGLSAGHRAGARADLSVCVTKTKNRALLRTGAFVPCADFVRARHCGFRCVRWHLDSLQATRR